MTLEQVMFQSVTIRNFRGFRDQQTINLSSSSVIVSGPNGTGKTSFFDALQWLLIGALPRFEALISRRSEDHIVSRFGQGLPAYVAADLLLQGVPISIRRTGNAKSTVLEWHGDDSQLRGAEAEDKLRAVLLGRSDVTLDEALLSSGILQQDVLRLVLQDDPKRRYRHMASLLGLHELTKFEELVKGRSEARRRSAAVIREQHATDVTQARAADTELQRLEERLSAQPALSTLRDQLASELHAHGGAFSETSLPLDLAASTALGQTARQVRNRVDQLLADLDRVVAAEARVEPLDSEELTSLRGQAERAREESRRADAAALSARESAADARRRSDQWVLLARQALPLLGPSCPICEQPITPGEIEDHLRQVIAAGGEDLVTSEQSLTSAEQSARTAAVNLELIEGRLRQAEQTQELAEAARVARLDWLTACERLASDTESLSPGAAGVRLGDTGLLMTLRSSAEVLAGVSDQMVAALSASTLGEQLERQRGVLDQFLARAEASRESAAGASRQEQDAKALWDATTKAASAVTRIRFEQLQPLVNDIFSRLDPHPVFRTLRFDLDVSYRSGVADPVVEDDEGVSGDPLLVFSSSQTNVAALTYFLALSWAAEANALPFLLLDDPLQSMDDVNILGFADLCRHIRSRRQLIVSTHEARLTGLLERKLAPRDGLNVLRVIRFVGWDRSGPKIEEHLFESEGEIAYLLRAQ